MFFYKYHYNTYSDGNNDSMINYAVQKFTIIIAKFTKLLHRCHIHQLLSKNLQRSASNVGDLTTKLTLSIRTVRPGAHFKPKHIITNIVLYKS